MAMAQMATIIAMVFGLRESEELEGGLEDSEEQEGLGVAAVNDLSPCTDKLFVIHLPTSFLHMMLIYV